MIGFNTSNAMKSNRNDLTLRCQARPFAVSCFTSLFLIVVGCSPTSRSPESAASPSASTSSPAIAAKYEHQLVRRPGNAPEDGKVYVVLEGKKRWVTHAEWVRAHGYNWPNDVHEIPASELEAIPTGPPIEGAQ